jgi:hypothetical protein
MTPDELDKLCERLGFAFGCTCDDVCASALAAITALRAQLEKSGEAARTLGDLYNIQTSNLRTSEARVAALEAGLKQATATIVAAVSLIKRAQDERVYPAKAVASHKMFWQMVDDYEAAAEAARALLTKTPEEQP